MGRLVSLISIVLIIAILYFVREVFIPLALALLFSFLLTPVVRRLERWKVPRVPAALLAVSLACGVVLGVGFLVGGQLVELIYKLPDYQDNLSRKIDSLHFAGTSPIKKATETFKELANEMAGDTSDPGKPGARVTAKKQKAMPVEIVDTSTNVTTIVRGVFGPLLGPLGTATIVLVFVLFMLIKREDLRDRMIHLMGRGQLTVTTQALDEAGRKLTGYLFMQMVVNVSFGIPIGIGLYFIGIPNAFLWGLLAILLRFIPYVGAWIALGFPLVLSLAVSDTWRMPLLTFGLFAVIELVTANFLEPLLYGAHTGLSPVAIMVATIFWTWLWGGVGLLLAMPLTVCVAVIGRYIPNLRFIDALLGEEPTLTPEDRYYQRLLALDRAEAAQVAAEFLKDHSLSVLYSSVLVPALATAERDELSGGLDARRQRFIFDTTRDLVEEIASEKTAAAKPANGAPRPANPAAALSSDVVFCLPAVDEADELAAVMLAQLLEGEGYRAESVSYKTLANEMLAQVAEARSQVVCISATPPHDTLHTRYLCKLLRSKFTTLQIIVGLWDAEKDEEKLSRRCERLAADKVVTTLTEALEYIRPFAALQTAEE